MNINNINSDVATMESPPVESPAQKTVPGINPVEKTEKVKDIKLKEESQESQGSVSAEEAKEITVDLNDYMNDLQTNLRFSIYEKLDHQVVVEIKNKQTDELIKQIPSEALLELRVKMEELSGLLFDEVI